MDNREVNLSSNNNYLNNFQARGFMLDVGVLKKNNLFGGMNDIDVSILDSETNEFEQFNNNVHQDIDLAINNLTSESSENFNDGQNESAENTEHYINVLKNKILKLHSEDSANELSATSPLYSQKHLTNNLSETSVSEQDLSGSLSATSPLRSSQKHLTNNLSETSVSADNLSGGSSEHKPINNLTESTEQYLSESFLQNFQLSKQAVQEGGKYFNDSTESSLGTINRVAKEYLGNHGGSSDSDDDDEDLDDSDEDLDDSDEDLDDSDEDLDKKKSKVSNKMAQKYMSESIRSDYSNKYDSESENKNTILNYRMNKINKSESELVDNYVQDSDSLNTSSINLVSFENPINKVKKVNKRK
jgi:hypothetical protein